jgi:MFS family permease
VGKTKTKEKTKQSGGASRVASTYRYSLARQLNFATALATSPKAADHQGSVQNSNRHPACCDNTMDATQKEEGAARAVSVHEDVESAGQTREKQPESLNSGEMSAQEKALVRKQDLRIVPISAGIYFLCFLDRANIGNARQLNSSSNHDMESETNMTNYQFVIALMVFLVAYAVFEVPSNILLKKLRPSRWIAFLMFGWGAMTISMGGVSNAGSVTAVRFLLGMFEAGLFPGLIYYLTFWYKHNERSLRVAFILASATLSGAFGGAIAYGIGHMNQVGGLSGWRWLFILEGIPSCLSAFVVLFFLPDYPERVNWLSEAEKDLAVQRMYHEGSKADQPSMTWADAKETLTDWRLYAHYAIYFAMSPAFASLSLFAPTITSGLGYVDLDAQLMTVPPWAVAYGK